MTLKQLRYLICIADNGLNISSAAEKLFTSQPGISKQLKYLEAELGMHLAKENRGMEGAMESGILTAKKLN